MWGIEREVKEDFKDFGPDGQKGASQSVKMKTENPFGFGNIEVLNDIDKSNLDREGY